MGEDTRGKARRDERGESALAILMRMLADADRLRTTDDPLLCGLAAQLHGRLAAMVVLADPAAPNRLPEVSR